MASNPLEEKKAEILSLILPKPKDLWGTNRDEILEYEAVEKKIKDINIGPSGVTNLAETLNKPLTTKSKLYFRSKPSHKGDQFYGEDIPPLIWAIRERKVKLVESLLQIGADPNLKIVRYDQPPGDYYHNSPLDYTIDVNLIQEDDDLTPAYLKIAILLLNYGATIDKLYDIRNYLMNMRSIPRLYRSMVTRNPDYMELINKLVVKAKEVLTPKEQTELLHVFTTNNPESREYMQSDIIVREMMKQGYDIHQPITAKRATMVVSKSGDHKWIEPGEEINVYDTAHPVMKKKVLDEFVRKDYEKAVAESSIGKKLPDVLSPIITDYLVPRPKKAGTRKRLRRKQNKRKRLLTKRRKH